MKNSYLYGIYQGKGIEKNADIGKDIQRNRYSIYRNIENVANGCTNWME